MGIIDPKMLLSCRPAEKLSSLHDDEKFIFPIWQVVMVVVLVLFIRMFMHAPPKLLMRTFLAVVVHIIDPIVFIMVVVSCRRVQKMKERIAIELRI